MKLKYAHCWMNRRIDAAFIRTQVTGRRVLRWAFVVALPVAAAGCSTLAVKPWEHDLLAEHAMQVDAYPLETSMDDHIYFSKEASSGGRSFAGGGCGCN